MQKLIGRAHHKFLNSLGNAMKKVSAQIGTYHNAQDGREDGSECLGIQIRL